MATEYTAYLNCYGNLYIGRSVYIHCSVSPYSTNKGYVFTIEYETTDKYGVKQVQLKTNKVEILILMVLIG